jgi:hypothetical protein
MTGHGDALMAEYAALKAEQLARIGTRDNLLYATLASVGAVVAAALTARQAACLLMVPPACTVLGWTYLANDSKISAIREYTRAVLAPRLDALGAGPAFGWESAHLNDALYAARRGVHHAVDLLMFAVTPAAALLVCLAAYAGGPEVTSAVLFLTGLSEAGMATGLAWWIVRCFRHPAAVAAAALPALTPQARAEGQS